VKVYVPAVRVVAVLSSVARYVRVPPAVDFPRTRLPVIPGPVKVIGPASSHWTEPVEGDVVV
jgi:hypothetical protein